MAASVSLSAITPAFAADDASENSVIESEISDGGNSDDETPEEDEVPPADGDNSNNEVPPADDDNSNKDEVPPANEDNPNDEVPPADKDNSNKDEVPPANEDTPNEGEQTPPANEDNSNKDEIPPANEDNSNKEEETPNNTLEEEKTPETPTVKPDGYSEVTQAGGKGDSFVTLEIVNDGSSKPNPNPNPGGGGEDPDNPGGGGGGEDPDNPGGGGDEEDPDNPGGGGEDPDPVIFSAYVPSKLPMKLTEDGTVLTPNNAAIINGVATKGIVVKDIEAHLDYDWIPEDWDADYPDMPVNTKKVGLKLRGDTLSKDGDFSVNVEDWKIPKDSYIDLNMEAKLPPQEIETPTQNSDVAILSFTLDWSGDDTTTGPKWEGGAINPDTPTTTPSKPEAESNDTIVVGGSGDIHITWDSKDNTVTLDSVTSSDTDVVSVGNTTGSNGNKTATVNGLKGGTSTITATLSNGETVTYEVIVYEVGNPDDIKVSVSDKKFNVGDSITSNDVTASIPLIAPDGSTKTMTVKPSVDKNTLQAGSNSLTGTVTVGNQEYPIHFDVAVENPDDNKSDITAESTDTLVEGETGEVTFTWDTKVNTITLKSITSSDESIATVGTITGADGSKKVTINALAYGKANITATLNNGEIAVFEAEVYKVGNANDIQVTVNNPDLGVGDKVTSNDITVKVPVISPDGDTKYIEKTPSIEDKVLQAGDNTITGTVTAGKSTITISVTVTVEETNVPVSVTSTTYIVGNENNPINFKWNTEGDTITLSNVTSSNTDVATIKTTKGDEGNKTVDLDCLKAGTTNIDLTFSNGAASSYEISVYELGNLDDVKVVVADKEFNAGDTLTSDDVTVKVPLIDGNGDTKMVDMSVDFEDTTLKAGTNDFSFNLSIAGQNCPIHFEVITPEQNDDLSMTLAEAQDLGFTFRDYEDGLEVVLFSNPKNVDTIEVPGLVDGKKVLSLGDYSFSKSSKENLNVNDTVLREVILPDTIENIGASAFLKCMYLSSINIPDNVTSIGKYAFEYCNSLKCIDLPKALTYLGDYAFKNCVNLVSIEIPKSITSLYRTFDSCSRLTSVSLHDGMTHIGYRTFYNCSSLKSITIPESVTYIGDNAFDFTGLEYIVIPESVETLSSKCFYDAKNLKAIYINKPKNSISGAKWYASYATVYWQGEFDEQDIPGFQDSNKSNIKAESNDTLVAGGTGNVAFTWDTRGNAISLTGVTSSNTDVATVGNTTGSEGSKTTVLNALKGGTSTITATLNNGETATFEATVYEMGNPDDIQTTVNNKDLSAGDKVTPNDVTVKVPVVSPDGSTKLIEVTPSIEDKALEAGDNTLTGTVNIGGQDYPFTFDVTAELPDDMKSGLKAEANDLVVSGGNGNVNFKWDTKGDTVTLSSITSSNQNVASVGAISGIEGNKMAAVNGLQGGTSTITATLSNGEKASVDVPIHTVDTKKEMQVEVANKEFAEGDTLNPEDVTVKVPLTAPDGSTKYVEAHPTIDDTELEAGENTVEGTVTVGGVNLNVTITIHVEGGASVTNPSDGLVMSASEAQANGFTFGIYKEGVEITGFKNVNFKSTINVPAQIGDFMVLKVGDNVFQNQTNLKEITLPNSVTEIGNSTFAGCSNLAKFDTNKVTDIGVNAFANCTKMKTLTIPKCATIGRSAFDGCTSLTELNTNRVSEIGYGAFANCTGLKKVTFGNKLTTIGEKAFADCTGLTEIDTNNVVSIGANAFDSCDGLETLVLGENLTSIGNNAFNYCDSLTDVEINNPNTTLGTDVFSSCDASLLVPLEVVNTGTFARQGQQGVSELNMKIVQETKLADNALEECRFAKIVLPNGTTRIGNYAFANSKLKSITIPNGVTSIGNSAFVNSASLPSVTFPRTLASLGADSFKACTSFKEITLPDSLTEVGANTFADCTNLVTANLQSNAVSVSAGEFSNCTSLTTVTNLPTVQNIGASAFYKCGALSDIGNAGSLSNVQSIGANAFTDCTSLTELGSLDSLVTVEDRAFLNCTGISKLENVNKVQTIGNSAFENCTAIAEVDTLDALISVGNSAFKNCSKVPFIENVSNLETIGDSAFEGCTALAELGDIPKATSIGNRAFYDCTKLSSVSDAPALTSIGDSAFMNCTNLSSVGEVSSLTSIGTSAFKNCSSLVVFTLPVGVTAIKTSTFENCTSLPEADITNITSIGSSAYKNCTALKSAIPVGGVSSVGSSAFEGCSSLVYGPVSARSMGSRAFANCTSLQSIPSNVNFYSLGSYAFLNCSSMEGNLQINAAVTKIPEGVFKGCTGLTNLYLHGKLTEIGAHAFEGCSGIIGVSNLSIAKDLMNIKAYAFKDCTSLTSIALPSDMFYSENVSKWGLPIEAYAFYNTELTSLKLPQKTFGAGNFAFGECKNLKSVTLYTSDCNNYSATTFSGCDGIHFTINNLSFKPSAAPWGASNCTYSCNS